MPQVAFLKFRKILAVLRTSRCIFVAERTLDEGSSSSSLFEIS